MVADIAVAVSKLRPNVDEGNTVMLNTIVRVEAGQRISLFWTNDCECCIINVDNSDIFTHWTGEYLGSGPQFFPQPFWAWEFFWNIRPWWTFLLTKYEIVQVS